MGKHFFKTEADDAWFYFDPKNVLDTLRVVFVSECNENEDPSDAWRRLSDEAKNNRIKAVRMALKDITINNVEFAHPQVRNACDGITNVFNLFQFMDKNPDAILTCVEWVWGIEHGLAAEDIRAYISAGTLLKNLAPFIVEDILDIEAELYARGREKATSVEASDEHAKNVKPFIDDRDNTITLKTIDPEAWFWADKRNVADSLRVIFEDERIYGKGLTESWIDMDPDSKDARSRAIEDALYEIAITGVVFANSADYSEWSVGASSLYELFAFLGNHPEARLTGVYSGDEYFCSPSIGVRELLLHFAEDIAEDIIDIEHCGCEDGSDDDMEEKLSKLDSAIARCEREVGTDDKVVCTAKEARERIADETSPVEDFEAFMKEQYDKHKDRVDAVVDAYNYIANQEGISFAYNNGISSIKTVSVDDPVNHPQHYKSSSGLEAIDCIEAFTEDLPGDIGYLIGNAMKYLCRFDKKGKPVEDLRKAKWYIERAIKNIESRKM